MGRVVKCQYCGEKDTETQDMEFEVVGVSKPQKKYYHKQCYPNYLEEKEFKEKERKEKDELVEVIKDIYGVKDLPYQVFPLLESLRNGEQVFGGRKENKRYKQGYTYPIIMETYKYCQDTIEYWNSVKNFDGFIGAFKYGLSIVLDKLYIVESREKEKEQKEKIMDSFMDNNAGFHDEFTTNYKKKNNKNDDILDFLD